MRNLAEQRQPVPVPPVLLHEQTIEHRSQDRRQARFDQAYEIFLLPARPGTNQIGQPPCAGKLNPVCNQNVDAVSENEPGLEMRARHLRDLCDQQVFAPNVKRLEALQLQYAYLAAKPARLGITVRRECIERQIKCPGNIGDVACMIGFGSKEPSRRPEIAVSQKEPDPVHRSAQAFGRINDEAGEIEVFLALRAVESRRMIKARLFGRTQNARTGHWASR